MRCWQRVASALWEYLGLELTDVRGMIIKTGCRISHCRVRSSIKPAVSISPEISLFLNLKL